MVYGSLMHFEKVVCFLSIFKCKLSCNKGKRQDHVSARKTKSAGEVMV